MAGEELLMELAEEFSLGFANKTPREKQNFVDRSRIQAMLSERQCLRQCLENIQVEEVFRLRQPRLQRNRKEWQEFLARIPSVKSHAESVHNEERPDLKTQNCCTIQYQGYEFCVTCFQKVLGISSHLWLKVLRLAAGKPEIVSAC